MRKALLTFALSAFLYSCGSEPAKPYPIQTAEKQTVKEYKFPRSVEQIKSLIKSNGLGFSTPLNDDTMLIYDFDNDGSEELFLLESFYKGYSDLPLVGLNRTIIRFEKDGRLRFLEFDTDTKNYEYARGKEKYMLFLSGHYLELQDSIWENRGDATKLKRELEKYKDAMGVPLLSKLMDQFPVIMYNSNYERFGRLLKRNEFHIGDVVDLSHTYAGDHSYHIKRYLDARRMIEIYNMLH